MHSSGCKYRTGYDLPIDGVAMKAWLFCLIAATALTTLWQRVASSASSCRTVVVVLVSMNAVGRGQKYVAHRVTHLPSLDARTVNCTGNNWATGAIVLDCPEWLIEHMRWQTILGRCR